MKLDLQMFASTTIYGSTSSSVWAFKLEVTEGAYNLNTNSSPVTIEAFIGRVSGSSYMTGAEISCPITIAGCGTQTISGRYTTGTIPAGGWYSLGSTTFNSVVHENDGTKSINISASFTNDVLPSSGNASGSLTLDTIPRGAILSSIATFNIDTGFVFNSTKPVSTSYRKLLVKNGSTTLSTYYESELINESVLQLSDNINVIYALMANEQEHIFSFELYTYTNSNMETQIGNVSTKSGKGHITNANPIFTNFEYSDTNALTTALTGDNQKLIVGISNVQFTVSSINAAQAQKNSSIVSYTFGDGTNSETEYNTTAPITKSINSIQSNTLNVSVVDSRGFGIMVSKQTDAITNYTFPRINAFFATRKNGVGAETKLSLNATLWNGNFGSGNNKLKKLYYAVSADGTTYSNWYDISAAVIAAVGTDTSITITESDEILLHSNGISGGFASGQKFYIKLLVIDGIDNTDFCEGYSEVYELDDGMVLDSYYKSQNGYKYAINDIVDTTLEDGLQVSGKLYLNKEEICQPSGSITMYAGIAAPDGWLLCQGQEISRTDYESLFLAIGTTYGSGNGSTTFNLPDFKGKVPVGLNTSDTNFTPLGKIGGESTHTLTAAELAKHSHKITYNNQTYLTGLNQGGGTAGTAIDFVNGTYYDMYASDVYNDCENQPHNNLQPYIAINYIIKC